jgi:hypothetical protein
MQHYLMQAIDAALANDWHRAHNIVQQHEDDALACWIHAVLHKVEGDAVNSRYWYARTDRRYEDFADTKAELEAIRRAVQHTAKQDTQKQGSQPNQ